MEQEQMTSKITINAAPDAVFAVLTDPTAHAAIDGTGWVREPLDRAPLTHAGQFFRMGMYHENHPDKNYEIANRVEALEPPRMVAWMPGVQSPETGQVEFGGWTWGYDLEAAGPSQTTVTLTYDWSAATPEAREVLQFPPFGVDYLEQSLQHLSEQATA
jgi:hypothetical protein